MAGGAKAAFAIHGQAGRIPPIYVVHRSEKELPLKGSSQFEPIPAVGKPH